MKVGARVKSAANKASNVVQEFSRFAHLYDNYNMIQAKVATKLVQSLSSSHYRVLLDIGCGSGEVYKNCLNKGISIEHFIALDSSEKMLDLHPSCSLVTKICANFNDHDFIDLLPVNRVDMIVSSSALQWSSDLELTVERLCGLSKYISTAMFTAGTFRTLHETAGISSPIYSAHEIRSVFERYYDTVSFTLHHYKLDFTSVRDMFKYIKQSGVSSGERKLSYVQTKKLMRQYPLNYLEFEVLFIEAKN
jgi:malonyl-CoA O-methyltransferase